METDYRTALVTGASAGIGAAAARALAGAGLAVTAAARRADRLEALARETGATPLPLDLRDTDALYAALEPLEVDVLVANAGLGRGMDDFLAAGRGDIDLTVETNVTAFLHTLRAVLPGMRARGRGHVVAIGSVAGIYPIRSPIYGASKGAVRLASQNLRLDLAGSGVRVTEICPGRVVTEFLAGAAGEEEARRPMARSPSCARGHRRRHPLRRPRALARQCLDHRDRAHGAGVRRNPHNAGRAVRCRRPCRVPVPGC